jgi:polysaccharide pyruvyl transferase WcaK-like protein
MKITEVKCDLRDLKLQAVGCPSLYIIGADVIVGSSGSAPSKQRLFTAAERQKRGSKTTFISFSFRTDTSQEILQLLKAISGAEFILRDTSSQHAFENLTGLIGHYCPDTAFAAPIVTTNVSNHFKKLIRRAKADGKCVVALNWGIHGLIYGLGARTADSQIASINTVCSILHKKIKNLFVVLVSHDTRSWPGMPPDEYFCQQAMRQLETIEVPAIALDANLSFSEIMSIAELFDFSISCRMHFAIACLRNRVPSIIFRSNEKLRGFYQDYFGVDWLKLSPQSTGELAGALDILVKERETLRNTIDHNVENALAAFSV